MINRYESKEFIYTNGRLVLKLNCNFHLVTNTYRRVQEKHGQRFLLLLNFHGNEKVPRSGILAWHALLCKNGFHYEEENA